MTWCPLGQHWSQTEPPNAFLASLEREGKRWVCRTCIRTADLKDYPKREDIENIDKEETP